MTITLGDIVKLAKAANAVPELRSVVFDGQSAITAAPMEWLAGVPCVQAGLTEPVVVPVEAIQAHLLKSRHLIVMPDHLTNGQGLRTPFNIDPKRSYGRVLDMMPSEPEAEAVDFDLELNALDRVVIASGVKDVRYYLNGVMFDLSNGMLAASDGHRLHCYKNRVPSPYPREATERVEVIFGRAPLKWMLDSADETARVTIWNATRPEVEGRHYLPQAMLRAGDGFVFIRKAIDGRFPDYLRLIPHELSGETAQFNPAYVSDAYAAVCEIADQKHGKVTASLNHNGTGGALMVYERFAAVIMPWLTAETEIDPGLLAPL